MIGPITAMLPESLESLREIVAIVVVVVACFALGLFARTRGGPRLLAAFERSVLEKIPGFAVLRGVARRVSGQTDDAMFQPVLVEIEDALTAGSRRRSRRRALQSKRSKLSPRAGVKPSISFTSSVPPSSRDRNLVAGRGGLLATFLSPPALQPLSRANGAEREPYVRISTA